MIESVLSSIRRLVFLRVVLIEIGLNISFSVIQLGLDNVKAARIWVVIEIRIRGGEHSER
jgi:hypothetical protein